MSTEAMEATTPVSQKKIKVKAESESKSSKKRRHDQTTSAKDGATTPSRLEESSEHRKKKRRKEGSLDDLVTTPSSAPAAASENNLEDTPAPKASRKERRKSKQATGEAKTQSANGVSSHEPKAETEQPEEGDEDVEAKRKSKNQEKRNKKREKQRRRDSEQSDGEHIDSQATFINGVNGSLALENTPGEDAVQNTKSAEKDKHDKSKKKKDDKPKLLKRTNREPDSSPPEVTSAANSGGIRESPEGDFITSTYPTTKSSSAARPDASSQSSPFVQTTTSLLLPLAPIAYNFPLQGLLAEHVSPLLLTYYPPMKGILLSYDNPRLSESPAHIPPYFPKPQASDAQKPGPSARKTVEPTNGTDSSEESAEEVTSWDSQPLHFARSVDEYAQPFVWLTADFTLLRPQKGTWMSGAVRVQNPSWLGLVCWNWFNAGIPAKRLPGGWKWVDAGTANGAGKKGRKIDGEEGDEEGDVEMADGEAEEEIQVEGEDYGDLDGDGYWADEKGERVKGEIDFRLRDFDFAATSERETGFISFEGTLLSEEDDVKVDREQKAEMRGAKR